MPEATARAWRNGWFHTGDLAWRDAAGAYHFKDRLKDAIKRRGESVSSNEIELVAMDYPGVQHACAVGVPGGHGDEDILLAVSPVAGATIDPAELLRFLIPRMAHFMVPRYVRVAAALPQTYTGKISKADLRKEGLTADCWDREAAGITVRRDRLASI
jgi:crotonobetaine/carnitine-CoA ligase